MFWYIFYSNEDVKRPKQDMIEPFFYFSKPPPVFDPQPSCTCKPPFQGRPCIFLRRAPAYWSADRQTSRPAPGSPASGRDGRPPPGRLDNQPSLRPVLATRAAAAGDSNRVVCALCHDSDDGTAAAPPQSCRDALDWAAAVTSGVAVSSLEGGWEILALAGIRSAAPRKAKL